MSEQATIFALKAFSENQPSDNRLLKNLNPW